MFEKGQKLRVKKTDYPNRLQEGDILTCEKDDGNFLHVTERPGKGFYSWRFEAAPATVPGFTPKFRRGQKLRVVKIHSATDPFAVGDIVEAAEDSSRLFGPGSYEGVRLSGLASKSHINWYVARFEAAPKIEVKPPLFRKGQRLLVVEPDGLNSLSLGDIVVASQDSWKNHLGHDVVAIEGQPAFKNYHAWRFKPAPEEKTGPKNFKRGQKLVVLDASKSNGILKEGETVEAAADSFIGNEGLEIVFTRSLKTGMAGTFATKRFAPSPHSEFAETVYDSVRNGWSADIHEFDDGEEVAVYRLVRVGLKRDGGSID
jgi:hypothetical protein